MIAAAVPQDQFASCPECLEIAPILQSNQTYKKAFETEASALMLPEST